MVIARNIFRYDNKTVYHIKNRYTTSSLPRKTRGRLFPIFIPPTITILASKSATEQEKTHTAATTGRWVSQQVFHKDFVHNW